MAEQTIYQRNGFPTRRAYLEDLADNNGLPVDIVFMFAGVLGKSEDFDGLVNELEDISLLDDFA